MHLAKTLTAAVAALALSAPLALADELLADYVAFIGRGDLYNSKGADKENEFNNQESLWLVITFFILMTLMCDSGVIL